MKELSIEEKAKAYDEALERAKEMIKAMTNIGGVAKVDDIQHIFQLNESEDERIRKKLLALIEWSKSYTASGITTDEAKEMTAWLEKQDEQKPAEEYNIIGIGSKYPQGKLGEMIKNLKPVNEVLEQKPADKVEPKFHEGDWIITNKNHIWYVDETPETTSYLYRLINQYGKVEVSEFEIVDKKARLWTIQDAKDGDVLADDVGVILYRKIGNEMYSDVVDYHCVCVARSERFEIQKKVAYWGRLEDTKLYPATKEQRDLLFQKMKEAGYEWDAEKKELRKIEQKPTNNQFTPEQADVLDKHIDEYLEQNSTWSEDDENRFNNLIFLVECSDENKATKEGFIKFINKLKSLKERYTKNSHA